MLIFSENVQTHIDCRDVHTNYLLNFLMIRNMFFIEGAYAPGSCIEFIDKNCKTKTNSISDSWKEKLDYFLPILYTFSEYLCGICKASMKLIWKQKEPASEFWIEMFPIIKIWNCPIFHRRASYMLFLENPLEFFCLPTKPSSERIVSAARRDCHGAPPGAGSHVTS
jgi:hypothetical protein